MTVIGWIQQQWDKLVRRGPAYPTHPEYREIATLSLSDRWSQYPSQGLTPAKLRSIIQAADAGDLTEIAELFEEMEERDAHLAAVLQTRKLALQSLDWSIQPWDPNNRQAIEIAEFCEQAIYRISNWRQSLYDLLDAIGKGISVCEIIWVADGNRVTIESLNWIHPKRLTYSASLKPRLITDTNRWPGEEFPPWKTVIWTYRARSGWDNRAGLLRVVAWLFLLKNWALKDWASYNEVFGMPLRLGKYDPAATQADRDALFQAVKSLGSDAAGIISKTTEIEFVQAVTSSRENPYLSLLEFCNREISKAVLGQTLTTDTTGSTGTYAAGRVHEAVRRDILIADAQALGAVLTQQLLQPLVGFNFGWDLAKQLPPLFQFAAEAPEDLARTADIYKKLLDAKLPINLSHLCERFGLPPLDPAEPYICQDPNAIVWGGDTQGTKSVAAMSRINPDREAVRAQVNLDRIAQQLVHNSRIAGDTIRSDLMAQLEQANSCDEAMEVLRHCYETVDVTALADVLYEGIIRGYIAGYRVDG